MKKDFESLKDKAHIKKHEDILQDMQDKAEPRCCFPLRSNRITSLKGEVAPPREKEYEAACAAIDGAQRLVSAGTGKVTL